MNVRDDVTHGQSFNMTQSHSSQRSQRENPKLPIIGVVNKVTFITFEQAKLPQWSLTLPPDVQV